MKKLTIEQKAYDEAIKVGDWVVYDHRPYQVVELPKECYINLGLRGNGKIEFAPSTYCRHWTIQDAKDGDVLACNEEILLFKSYSVQGRISLYCWYNGQTNNFHSKEVTDTLLTTRNKIWPATKEQRGLLLQKMKEAGYKWDAEKKELKKVEHNPASEEDEAVLDALIQRLEGGDIHVSPHLAVKCLKSLKDRVQPQLQKQWKPTSEQIKALEAMLTVSPQSPAITSALIELYQQLKKLREE